MAPRINDGSPVMWTSDSISVGMVTSSSIAAIVASSSVIGSPACGLPAYGSTAVICSPCWFRAVGPSARRRTPAWPRRRAPVASRVDRPSPRPVGAAARGPWLRLASSWAAWGCTSSSFLSRAFLSPATGNATRTRWRAARLPPAMYRREGSLRRAIEFRRGERPSTPVRLSTRVRTRVRRPRGAGADRRSSSSSGAGATRCAGRRWPGR